MRFVIFGAGAIGGVTGARLHQSGHDVMLIARGAHHDAIRDRGLRLRTPTEEATLPIPVASGPREAGLRQGDVVLLATKSQDTAGAIAALREAAPAGLPVVCLQNGVENERVAARFIAPVYGAIVMVPSLHLELGVVCAFATRTTGTIDVGRYPDGVDGLCEAVCEALRAGRFESTPRADIMRHKHAKLINNLLNVVEVVCGLEAEEGELHQRLKEEGRQVLSAAGIPHRVEDVSDAQARFDRWGVRPIEGQSRGGSSSWQSAVRGRELETDYLNGEIVLRGRQQGVPAPLNALMQSLARQTMRDGREPGWISPAEILMRVSAG